MKAAVDSGECLLEWDYTKGEPTAPLLKDCFGSERRRAKVLGLLSDQPTYLLPTAHYALRTNHQVLPPCTARYALRALRATHTAHCALHTY